MNSIQGTLLPFLYPCLLRPSTACLRSKPHRLPKPVRGRLFHNTSQRSDGSLRGHETSTDYSHEQTVTPTAQTSTHLNPSPDDYSRNIFIDRCMVTVSSGSGGSGCVSFLRDVHISDGPPNGGDGGSGGSIYIQAVEGQTSLHKLARRGIIKAGRGIGGQGSSQGGRRGEDICVQVPVGTVVREIWRSDPQADEEQRLKELRSTLSDEEILALPPEQSGLRNKFVIYAGASTAADRREISSHLPAPTSQTMKPRRSHLTVLQPQAPIQLDLDKPMEQPILLCAGAVGGLGNPHFATKENPKPKFALKGELGIRIKLELELKLLADVGLVGLPNAGKSTFTRAISNSRTRIGNWAFTTLAPTIGTVILDNNVGRPLVRSGTLSSDSKDGSTIIPRASFTVADIPGLIEDAHLDKGLGLSFLRHIERARILAFVVDLSAGDAVAQLKALWKEVREYESLRDREVSEQSESHNRTVEWTPFEPQTSVASKSLLNDEGRPISVFGSGQALRASQNGLEPLSYPPISAKPWFVIATKADVPLMSEAAPSDAAASSTTNEATSTQTNFLRLHQYMASVSQNQVSHPSGRKNGWRSGVAAIPVSAIRGEGIDTVIRYTAGVLDSLVVGK
jgi:GTPase